MKKLILFIIGLLLGYFAAAQNGHIKGRILDNENQSLPGAGIILTGTVHMTVSDINGYYLLQNIPEGTYQIEIKYIGFKGIQQQVEVRKGETNVLNLNLMPGVETLGAVVVNHRLAGESKALNAQKSSDKITTVVSAEQLEKFPDSNIGDALKRIPGINVQYDQGEARFGNIRGTAPSLNSITINGERIPSAEAEIRTVQLDLVAADMINTVEYTKALTPDMDADAIGGSVNLVTKSAPYDSELYGQIGTGWNVVSRKPSLKGSLTAGSRFFGDKLGVMASASVYDNQLGSDNMEGEWDYTDASDKDGTAYLTNFQNRQYLIERLRQSYSLSLDYNLNKHHTLFVKGIYNKRCDWENRFRLEYKDIEWSDEDNSYVAEVRRQTKFGSGDNKYARLEDQRTMSFSLGGDHQIGLLGIDWMASYSKASEERPRERYIAYRAEDVLLGVDLSDMEEPVVTPENTADYGDFSSAWELKELTDQYQLTEEKDKNFKINFDLPVMTGEYANVVKFGFRYRGKEKMRDNWLREYEPVDEDALNALVIDNLKDVSKDNYMAGDYRLGHFINPKISDKLDLYNSALYENELDISEEAGDFNASENIVAGYLMSEQKLGSRLTVLAGLRLEHTSLKYRGKIYDVPSEEEEDAGAEPTITDTDDETDSYLNAMPSVHLKFSPNNASNIRLAWTNTLSRPNYFDLVPYQEINRDDEEIAFGNPALKPTVAMNFDLMYEYFFKSIGVFSAGVFYKDITDVIAWQYLTDYTYNGVNYRQYTRPENIGNATLYGTEAAFSRRLDFLPSFLSNLTVYGNYTYVKSKLKDIIFEGREDEDLPMGGTPNHTYNLSLAYDSKKFDVRISYNHTSAFLNVNDDGGFGEEKFYDFYYDKTDYLDVNADIQLSKVLTVYLNANNLLNQPLRTYWGETERTAQAEYYGIKLNAGLKFKL
ncbi:MAG: TonB-dependent receptor [Bacteroidales bacterium]|nr:TonB-dependent receptor [Bacteroidales bacterium]